MTLVKGSHAAQVGRTAKVSIQVDSPHLRAGAFSWTWGPTRERCCTVVAKLTFALEPGGAVLATGSDAEAVRAHSDGPPGGRHLADLAPFKAKADVLVTGLARPPSSEPFAARFRVGDLARTLLFGSSSQPVALPPLMDAFAVAGVGHVDATVDPSTFQQASAAEQVAVLSSPLELVLENLHPRDRVLACRLAWDNPTACLEGRSAVTLPLRLDTLLIDAALGRCVLTFRGWRSVSELGDELTVRLDSAKAAPRADTMADLPEMLTTDILEPRTARALPFSGPVAKRTLIAPAPQPTVMPAPQPTVMPAPQPTVMPAPQATVMPAPEPSVIAKPPVVSPQRVLPPVVTAQPLGLKAASDAAAELRPDLAARTQRAASGPPPQRTGPPLVLIWFDDEKLDAIRAAPRFSPAWPREQRFLLDQGRPADRGARHGMRALTLVPPAEASAIAALRADAVDDLGRFEPPLLPLAGQLTVLFDERKRLEAGIAHALATSGALKGVKEAAATAQLTADNEWATAQARELALDQLRDTIGRVSGQALTLFDTQLKRSLLEARAYRKRTTLGEPRLRFELSLRGGHAFPLLLPEALSPSLPLCESFTARIIAELHVGLDAFDMPAEALVAFALARELPATNGSGRT